MPIRTLIVDDEPLAREGVAMLVAEDAELDLVGMAANGEQAVDMISRLQPQLVFLDIQMPGKTGFDVLDQLDNPPLIIFITAYDRYAVQAFEIHALDYLLKPFSDERFHEATARAKNELERTTAQQVSQKLRALMDNLNPAHSSPTTQSSHRERLMIKTGGRVGFITCSDIDWVEAADYYAQLHVGDQVHLLRMSLNSLEEVLDPACFFRCHRSAIVNTTRIRKIDPSGSGDHLIHLHNGRVVKLSRSRRRALWEHLEQ